MHYLLAAIGIAGVTALMWKALRPQHPAARSTLAPDDDPDFLRGLNHKPGEEH